MKSAWEQGTRALPGLEKPDFAGSGEGHNRSALRNAAMHVMRGLVARTAEKLKTKAELERLMSTLDALTNLKPEARDLLKDEARPMCRSEMLARVQDRSRPQPAHLSQGRRTR